MRIILILNDVVYAVTTVLFVFKIVTQLTE
jgi:hypothetical protein